MIPPALPDEPASRNQPPPDGMDEHPSGEPETNRHPDEPPSPNADGHRPPALHCLP